MKARRQTPKEKSPRWCARVSSERRPQTKKYLKARKLGGLESERARYASGACTAAGAKNQNDKEGAIHLIAEVHADWTDRRGVASSQSYGVGEIVQLIGAVV